jgi:DNA-binding beta-propeller fold protein YncE
MSFPLRRLVAPVAVACLLSAGLGGITVAPANAAGITSTVTGFNNPQGVAVLPDGSAVYVVDSSNNAIKVISTATNTGMCHRWKTASEFALSDPRVAIGSSAGSSGVG